MFDFLNSGKLEKLTIESWSKIDRPGKAEKVFTAYINPDEFTINYSVQQDTNAPLGSISSIGKFLRVPPLEMSLKFFLDGTNSTGTKIDVAEEIRKFYQAVGYDGVGHRTRYLRLKWGKLSLIRNEPDVLDCCLKSASIQYKLFKPDGTPLRAIITATFVEVKDYEKQEQERLDSSPDLTHVRTVMEGDTLPGMTYKIYGDLKYYLEVAKVNKLDDFRSLKPGTKIFFPPFDKNVKPKTSNA